MPFIDRNGILELVNQNIGKCALINFGNGRIGECILVESNVKGYYLKYYFGRVSDKYFEDRHSKWISLESITIIDILPVKVWKDIYGEKKG